MHESYVQPGLTVDGAFDHAFETQTRRVIKPVRRRLKLSQLWSDRQVIRVMAARDFKARYKQSLLGPIWLVFQPLALLAAFFIAFRNLANVQPGVPYSVFALSGLSVWAFFQASMTIGAASIVSNIMLVRFTPCPRFTFPLSGVISSLPAWGVTTTATIVIAAATGVLSWHVVLLPVGFLWLFLLTAGFVGLVSSFTVRYRDILTVMPFLLQVGVFVTPIGYPLSQLSSTVRAIVELNPLTGLVEAWRWMIVSGYSPPGRAIAFSLVITAAVVVGGWRVF